MVCRTPQTTTVATTTKAVPAPCTPHSALPHKPPRPEIAARGALSTPCRNQRTRFAPSGFIHSFIHSAAACRTCPAAECHQVVQIGQEVSLTRGSTRQPCTHISTDRGRTLITARGTHSIVGNARQCLSLHAGGCTGHRAACKARGSWHVMFCLAASDDYQGCNKGRHMR